VRAQERQLGTASADKKLPRRSPFQGGPTGERASLGKRILIAEDEHHLAESLTFILEREGYDVTTAFDGEAAMQQIWAAAPDLLILDVMLPKINGFDLLKKIRAHDDLKTLRVIILTAKGQRQDREIAMEMGADLFLTKPFSNKDIVKAVGDLVAS